MVKRRRLIEEEAEPSPEDYVMTPCGRLGSKTCVSVVEGKFVGEFSSDRAAGKEICARMKREQFFPGIWYLSDHGNFEPRRLRCR